MKRSLSYVLRLVAAILVLACSANSSSSQMASVSHASLQCSTAVVGKIIPGEVIPPSSGFDSLPLAALVNRTVARVGIAYIAAMDYCRTTGRGFPASATELLAYGKLQPLGKRCAVRDTSQLYDEWGNAFVWGREGSTLAVISPGPDRKLGSDDDIASPPPLGSGADTVDVQKYCSS